MRTLGLLLFCVVLCVATRAQAQFYYAHGDSVPLRIDSSFVTIVYDEYLMPPAQQSIPDEISRVYAEIVDEHAFDGFHVYAISSGAGLEAFIDSVQAIDGVYLAEPYYRSQVDSPFLVGRSFCVRFNPEVSSAEIDSINADFGVAVGNQIPGLDNTFVLLNTDSSGERLLNLANVYCELDETIFSQPEFGVWLQFFGGPYDYYGQFQSHIWKVIGAGRQGNVWEFAGLTDSVIIAMVDDGVEWHEDLPSSRILPGFDYYWRDYDPSPGDTCAHGMGCAGIIAASHSSTQYAGSQLWSGIISMNPHAFILPIKIAGDDCRLAGMLASEVAGAIVGAAMAGADVLSCSWGYNPCVWFYNPEVIEYSLDLVTQNGRNGKGCPVIFASGNGGDGSCEDVSFPANLPYCFAVGATSLEDVRLPYSSYGPELDLMAPSDEPGFDGFVWTLDRMGDWGYNPHYFESCLSINNNTNYNCRFGGTSAAAPVVAGAASLLLSRDSMLTADEVYDILRYSAVTESEWIEIDPPDDEYGWGRVDAYRAILAIARGDADNSGEVDITDVSVLVDNQFLSLTPLAPDPLLGDCSCDGQVDVTDVSVLVDHLFQSLAPLPLPCYEYGEDY